MKRGVRILSASLFILTGLLFLLSGATKLFPVEYFEISLIEKSGLPWLIAPVTARIIIGLEWLLGLMLIFHFRIQNFTFYTATGMLAVFSVQLTYQLLVSGNSGNCGCFGSVYLMSPLEALLKNIVMIALLVVARRTGFAYSSKKRYLFLIMGVLAFSLVFILNPVKISNTKNLYSGEEYKINLDTLYTDGKNEPPQTELRQGKYVLAFISVSCEHCRMAAYKIAVLKRQHPEIPFFLIINGNPSLRGDFFSETGSEQVPHSFFSGPDAFMQMSGPVLPAIYFIDNSTVKARVDYQTLDNRIINEWLNGQ